MSGFVEQDKKERNFNNALFYKIKDIPVGLPRSAENTGTKIGK